MLVCDTSSYINGQRDHLPLPTFPTVWRWVGDAIRDGRIVLPRQVFREVLVQDDDVAAWIAEYESHIAEPTERVQRRSGELTLEFPNPGVRNAADPFVLAEAELRGFTVVTYEGRSFRGVPTTRWTRSMPGVCQRFGIPCSTLPEALAMLGVEI
jgi:Domain of unknown function (DUF4411)